MEQKGFTVWFTGHPCSGKSSIADAVAQKLKERGLKVERLDGDTVRKSLSKDLGFSEKDRYTHIERVTFVAKLLTRNKVAVVASFISPYREMRASARKEIGDFVEVYVKCPLKVCMERDGKELYKKAIAGEIKNFTGISHPYEAPESPEIVLETDNESVKECAEKVIQKLEELMYI
ncbi:MAG: adenylyl-sulfate kinase [Theionarchaea archaeon]|nr:adenylyl-sulfate kinase [Theionarchaea archaeon]